MPRWGSPTEVPCTTLFDDYIAVADKIGVRRKQEETIFGKKLKKLAPDLRRERLMREISHEQGGSIVKRVWCYMLPPIERARESFKDLVGQDIDWPPLLEEPMLPPTEDM